MSSTDTGRAQPRDDDGFFESIQWRRWLRVIARRIGLGLRTYEDVEIKLQPCENWMDDVMRFLLLLTFAYQMVLFSLHYRSYRNKHGVQVVEISPLWYASASYVLLVLLVMVLRPAWYLGLFWAIFERGWRHGVLAYVTPLGRSTVQDWYTYSDRGAYIPYYGAWVVYIIIGVIPRLCWMVFASVPTHYGSLIPDGFLVITLVLEMMMTVGYLYNIKDSSRSDPFEVVYLLLNASKKAVLEILDMEAILNSLGTLQKDADPVLYLTWGFLIIIAVTIHLVLTTLEVHFKRRNLWNLSGLKRLLTAADEVTTRYARTSVLFFVVYLTLAMASDVIIFTLRLLFAISYGPVSPFMYKTIFYILVHGCHMFTLMTLLVQAKTIKARESAERRRSSAQSQAGGGPPRPGSQGNNDDNDIGAPEDVNGVLGPVTVTMNEGEPIMDEHLEFELED